MGTRACDVLQRACVDLSKCTHPLTLPAPSHPRHHSKLYHDGGMQWARQHGACGRAGRPATVGWGGGAEGKAVWAGPLLR